jgi:hypothetical protein
VGAEEEEEEEGATAGADGLGTDSRDEKWANGEQQAHCQVVDSAWGSRMPCTGCLCLWPCRAGGFGTIVLLRCRHY